VHVEKDLPGVGENLQDHLQIRAVFKVKNTTTLNTQASLAAGQGQGLVWNTPSSAPAP
jgi:choline dehydrogenase